MSSLYIDRRFTRLACESSTIVPYINEARHSTVPMALLNHLVIVGNIELDTRLLVDASEAGIVTTLIGGRYLSKSACVYGAPGNDIARRITQYQRSVIPDYCLSFSMRLVSSKIRGHRQVVSEMITRRPQQRKSLTQCLSQLTERLQEVQKASSIDQLLGIEGAAARAFFHALQHSLPASLEFTGRNRRPPPDPVNAMLSLSYTLLHSKAVLAIRSAGLDPTIGFYHQPLRKRDSLACDLVEPIRPRVDRWVWNGFSTREWRDKDFSTDASGSRLIKASRGRYFAQFEKAAAPWARALARGAAYLARTRHSDISREPN